MFHVNAWGVPYAAIMVGSKLVFPGPKMADGETLQALIEQEQVTYSSGVPTIWMALLNYLETSGKKVTSLKSRGHRCAACPMGIIERFNNDYDVTVIQGWGMTEMSPLGTIYSEPPQIAQLSQEERITLQSRQGRPVFGVELKIVDEDNNELPWDGVAFGALKVRGPWIASGYYGLSQTPGDDSCPVDADGWFKHR